MVFKVLYLFLEMLAMGAFVTLIALCVFNSEIAFDMMSHQVKLTLGRPLRSQGCLGEVE